MTHINSQDNFGWYVLNHISPSGQRQAQKDVDRFNTQSNKALELFAPTYVVKEEKQGEIKFRTVSLTFHYVFVRGSLSDVKQLCAQPNGFSLLIDHGSANRYAMIDDHDMVQFQNIARIYKNCLPYYSLKDIDLQDGDLVEVVKGDFPGLIGTYMPNARSKTGNIVLNVYNNIGTIAFNVKATDVRVIEFSPNSTRANDQIDAFVPHLLSALRFYHDDEAVPSAVAAKLSVFCGRMGIAKLNNRKLDARLQILLYAANHIAGNHQEAQKALEKFNRVSDSVTNEWTKATISLIQAVISDDRSRLRNEWDHLKAACATSKAQQMVLKEYEHYLCANHSEPVAQNLPFNTAAAYPSHNPIHNNIPSCCAD